ncbi:hypothetical protein Csa_005054 [Cucumis sativus]|nr:hypothetical protein Csa_005054 [Cucumis sativus]
MCLVETNFIQNVHENDVLIHIVVGETGSGKTTQIPQFLFNAGFCRHGKAIGVTQPRRIAALSVAKRVAEECGVVVGEKVGYSIRFEDVTSSSTRIKYMTDGILLREALLDSYLSRYSVIIVDEAHERTVDTDVLLGYLKRVQKARSKSLTESSNDLNTNDNGLTLENRNSSEYAFSLKRCQGRKLPPLKLIIMSASLNAPLFSEFSGGAKVFHVHGRQYPVAIFYTRQPILDYIEGTLITIF